MGLAAVNIVKVADNLEKLKSGPAFWVYQERVVAKIQSEWSDQVLTSAIFDDIFIYTDDSVFSRNVADLNFYRTIYYLLLGY